MKETKLKNYEFCLIYLPDLIKPFYHQYITVGLRKMGVCGKQRFFTLFPVFWTNKNRFQLEIMG